jgi:hypothetical protein
VTTSQLRAVQQAMPFRPFTLELADGSRVDVPHPELLLITPGGRTVVVATGDDAVKIIDLLLVSAIDVRNGARKRPRKRK